jgi:hypothetical protein
MNTLTQFLTDKGMAYDVLKEQAIRKNSKGEIVDIDGQFNLVRSTDEHVISPGTVSERYSLTSPSKMCEPIAPLVAEGWITPDKGFLFKDGSYEVVSFEMNASELENDGEIAGEQWRHWVSLHNHQGGGGGLKGSITSFRVVCANTAAAAAREACFSIRHTGDIDANYKWAIDRWQKLKDSIKKLSERMTTFAVLPVSPTDALDALHKLYGVSGMAADDISTRTANELEFAMTEFANPRRGTFGKTGLDLFNAITATNSHYSPKNSKESSEKRLSSIYDVNGSRFKLESAAVSLLEKMAGV